MSDQTPSAEQSAFEEAITYLDSLPPGELERRMSGVVDAHPTSDVPMSGRSSMIAILTIG